MELYAHIETVSAFSRFFQRFGNVTGLKKRFAGYPFRSFFTPENVTDCQTILRLKTRSSTGRNSSRNSDRDPAQRGRPVLLSFELHP